MAELKQIHSRDDLLLHTVQLEKLFNQLVDVIIQIHEYKDLHPTAAFKNDSKKENLYGDQLRVELNRILQMEGGREVIEHAQESALNRLDLFEQARNTPKTLTQSL